MPEETEPILAEKLFTKPVTKSTSGGRLPQMVQFNLEYGPVGSGKEFCARYPLKDMPEAVRTDLLNKGIPQLEAWLKEQG